MAYRYEFTPLALSDLDNAFSYITEKLSNNAAAKRLMQLVRQVINDICENPYAYPNCSYYLIDDENTRHTVIRNYVLIYAIDKGNQRITILRFLYGGMDITNMEIK